MTARLDLATLRAALWTARALRSTKRELAERGLEGTHVTPPPPLPTHARRGVMVVIRRRPNTCLERALVLQRWEAAHGSSSDVVIGVPGRGDDFIAHAWLEHMPDGQAAAYHEIHRIPAPVD
jgi:transglutaminase superfamily protein